MAEEGGNHNKGDKAPAGIRFIVRVWGAIAALCMISTGLFVLITVTGKCLIAGILQISCGALVLAVEAPIFCAYFDFLIKIGDFIEYYFRFWMRAFLYLGFALPPCFLCFETSTFIGCGSLMVLAALYGVLAIGKKGSAKESPRSKKSSNDDVEMKASLMTSKGEPNDLNTY